MTQRNLGNALAAVGQLDDAIASYEKTLKIQPQDALAHYSLGKVFAAQRKFGEAAAQYRKAAEIQPRYLMAHGALAWLLATCPESSLRDGAAAVEHARWASQRSSGQPEVLDVLAAAYAEAGRFPEAVATARKALHQATQKNKRGLADALRGRIALYEAGKPYRQTPSPSSPSLSKP